jgi:hypothetical protein
MKIIELVRIVPETLWAARFEGIKENEYDRIFDLWSDPEYLDGFFTKYQQDLVKDFYGYCSISQAVSITLSEADEFERQLVKVAEGRDLRKRLGDIFKPLEKTATIKIEKDLCSAT